jgi:Flp pilus assembly protein TadD
VLRRLALGAVLISALTGALPAEREAARRENNRGVALLEQFRPGEAVESFRKALALDPAFVTARVNLGIALFYVPDVNGARQTLEEVFESRPDSLEAHYVLGLIARQENRVDDALARFRRVLEADPEDVGANVGAAQVLLQQRREADALPLLEVALRAEPYNLTAAYNLAIVLSRTGHPEEAARANERFQQLRDRPYKTALGHGYLEQGRYAEALATTGAEPGQVERATPRVVFADRTAAWLPKAPAAGGGPPTDWAGSPLTLADLDGDGHLDLVDATSGHLRLLRNEGLRFRDVTMESGVSGLEARAAVAGDFDNDGHTDLLVLQPKGLRLLKGDGAFHFTDVTARAHIPPVPGAVTAALVDVDHDGDLDILVAGADGQQLLRNNGDGTFTDITTEAGLSGGGGHGVAIVPTDFDEHRDIDLLVVYAAAPPALYKNLRDGRFQNVAAAAGLPSGAGFSCVAAADVNKDGFTDFFFGSTTGPGLLALSDGRGRFAVSAAPDGTKGSISAMFIDYDRDGLLDLLVLTPSGPRLFRNLGGSWADVTADAFPGPSAFSGLLPGFWAGDVDGDGAQDLVVATRTGPRVLRAEGAGGHSFRVEIAGRVSNRSAAGTKVEVRAGSLRQKLETSAATPPVAPADLVFGLGDRTRPDAVRVLWPSGILQSEVDLPPQGQLLKMTELDRKASSCPYLYAWDGTRFSFVTDFLGGGEMGYWEAPGVRNHPNPTEDVRLTDRQLVEQAGRYALRVTNELEEVLFLDEVHLLGIAHPADVEVYPNEGMTGDPRPPKLWAVKDLKPPTAAFDDSGRDVREELARLDRTWPDSFPLLPIRGYAREHTLTLDLSGLPKTHTLLVLTGWTDYAFSSDNVAASQSGLALHPPRLEVEAEDGSWQTAMPDIGIPVGRPQTMVLDLRECLRGHRRRVRIVTNMRIYWDQIRVGAEAEGLRLRPEKLNPLSADLRERGFSAEVSPDGHEPMGYDYARVSWSSPWKLIPGRYTRPGDVRELLAAADDLFVVSRPGDEIGLTFDSRALAPLPPGWRRTFLLHGDGFSKEMDIHSATPDALGPLPFHGMSHYPYDEDREAWPSSEQRRTVMERYTTRLVRDVLPSLDGLWANGREQPADETRP